MEPMRRIAATALWGYAFWYLGAMLASTFSAPQSFGLILGIAAGGLIGWDPRGLFWPKASHPSPRVAARLASMASPGGAR